MASDITFGEDLLFPNEYLSSVDLNGKELVLAIGTISKQELRLAGGGKKVKPVIEFKIGEHPDCQAKKGALKCPCQKKFVVNVTNAETIKFVTGEKAAEKWIGHRVTFFVGRTSSPKGIVDCLRIREKKHEAPAPKQDVKPKDAKPDTPAVPDSIPKAWIDAIKKAEDLERLKQLNDQGVKRFKDEALMKEFAAMLDARAAEIKAAELPPTDARAKPQRVDNDRST